MFTDLIFQITNNFYNANNQNMVEIRPNFQLLVQKRDKEDGGNLSQVL